MNVVAGVGMIALSLVLVGSAVIARHRGGQPVRRYAMIWAVLVALGFAAALIIDRYHG